MAVFSYSAKILYPGGNGKSESVKNMHLDRKMLRDTIGIYRAAVSFLINAAEEHYEDIKEMNSLQTLNYMEKLVHNTKNNSAVYRFDEKFPQFPGYFRRAAVSAACGAVRSCHTNMESYEIRRHAAISAGQKFRERPPVLNRKPHAMPTFYKGNMYVPPENGNNEVELKLYINGKWGYVPFRLREQDVKYIRKFREEHGGRLTNPTLEYSYGRFHLRYGVDVPQENFTEKENVKDMVIMAVDLGINSDAVCTVMRGNGTIISRNFIDLGTEKAGLYRLLNRKKKLQRMSGNWKYAPLYKITTKIRGVNGNLANKTEHGIVDLAVRYCVDTVVFESQA